MAGLIKRNQIDGLVEMKALLDEINASYPASKVTTTVVKTPESSEGAGDQVYYTGQELLAELKADLDSVVGGGDDGSSLPELQRLINKLNAELNGGSYITEKGGSTSTTLNGFKNKEINDVVRVEFNLASGTTTATPKDATKITDELDSSQKLHAYTLGGAPIVGEGGVDVDFDFDTKTFAATPYVLDVDATKAAGGVDSVTGEIIPAQAVYTAFTGDFKVFPVGTWTLETLPATALLDNNEMQLIAYDQALQKVIIQLATDKNLIDRITEAVGETAIEDAVKSATAVIDSRLDVLEGKGSDALAASVKLNQLEGTAETAAGADDAEAITASTKVYTKNKSDELLKAITDDIGKANAAANYDANQNIASGTVRSEVNALKERFVDKTKIVNSIKSSVTTKVEDESNPGQMIDKKQTDDQNTISETALVDKFAALDSKDAQLTNQLNTFIDTTAPATYVAQTQVTDTFTKITKDADTGTYTDTYTDPAHKEVVGKKLFNEQISEIRDSLSAGTGAAYLREGIVLAEAVEADATKGITAKNAETVSHIDNNIAAANIPVYSAEAVDNKLTNEAEERAFVDAAIDAKTYDWANIVADDGMAIQGSVSKTTFTVATGAEATADENEVFVAADTAETKSELTAVDSSKVVDKKITAAKAELSSKEAADKLELKNRIEHGDAVQARALAAEVARLTATNGDTLAEAGYGKEAIVATADGVVKQLQDTRVQVSQIETSAGIAADIVDENNMVVLASKDAEAAASLTTKVASKTYVDDSIAKSSAMSQVSLKSAINALDSRIDSIEGYTTATERHVVEDDGTSEYISLDHMPVDGSSIEVIVNGVTYFIEDGIYTIENKGTYSLIVWDAQAAGFALGDVVDEGERVVARYTWFNSSKVTAGVYTSDSAVSPSGYDNIGPSGYQPSPSVS